MTKGGDVEEIQMVRKTEIERELVTVREVRGV
jgi:hypothetical protein